MVNPTNFICELFEFDIVITGPFDWPSIIVLEIWEVSPEIIYSEAIISALPSKSIFSL